MNDKKMTLDHRRTRVAKLIKIDEDAYTFLEKIKKDNKVSMNEIINQIIISFMEKNSIYLSNIMAIYRTSEVLPL